MNNYIEFNGKKWILDKLKVQKRLRTLGVTVKNFRIYADDHGPDKNIMIGAIYSTYGVNSEHQWRHVEFGVPGSYNSPFKEYNEWEYLPVDTKCWVKNDNCDKWIPRYFSGELMNGIPLMFPKGLSSFTMNSASIIENKEFKMWKYYKVYDESASK
jgi:hypothetical protein